MCLALLGDKVKKGTRISMMIASQSNWKSWQHRIQYSESILPKHSGIHYCSNLLSSQNFNEEILLRLQAFFKILNFSLNHRVILL